MKKIGNLVGLVGWRGMVGSVLMDRMQAEGDFGLLCATIKGHREFRGVQETQVTRANIASSCAAP